MQTDLIKALSALNHAQDLAAEMRKKAEADPKAYGAPWQIGGQISDGLIEKIWIEQNQESRAWYWVGVYRKPNGTRVSIKQRIEV